MSFIVYFTMYANKVNETQNIDKNLKYDNANFDQSNYFKDLLEFLEKKIYE